MTVFCRCSFQPEVGGDVISGYNAGQAGLDVPVKFGDSSSYGYTAAKPSDWAFLNVFNFINCQPEVVSENFGDSRLKPSEASFLTLRQLT